MNEKKSLVFCFDTSAFVDIHRYLVRLVPQLYPELEKLFNSGRLVSHKIVFQEITTRAQRPDPLTRWILPRERFFKDITVQQTLIVSEVVQKFPALIHWNKEKDDADPWLIALILEQRSRPDLFLSVQDFAIVSAESTIIAGRLPEACRYYNITHLDLLGFFQVNGWRLSLNTGK